MVVKEGLSRPEIGGRDGLRRSLLERRTKDNR